MGRFFRRLWSYLTASANRQLEERADPRVQIDQAITESQKRHAALSQQAAAVIGSQRQLEMQLARQLDEVDKLQNSARQALVLAEQSRAGGDAAKATEYEAAAQTFATQLVSAEATLTDLKAQHEQAVTRSAAAKEAVDANATRLKATLAERSKLLGQLEAAKMQEQANAALQQVSALSAPGDTPTLDDVRSKIEARYARALGTSEIVTSTPEARMLEVQKATVDATASARLEQLRASLGGAGGAGTAGGTPALGAADGTGA